MNTEKIAFNKVAKIKTDLSLIDDLQKIKSDIDNILSQEIKLRTEASRLNSRAKELDKDYKKLVSSAKSKADEASNKVKELGISEPAILESIYDSFNADIYKNITREFR